MAKPYQHRIGVRAEICFDLIFDICDPAPQQISQAVAEGSPTDRGRRRRLQARSPNWWSRIVARSAVSAPNYMTTRSADRYLLVALAAIPVAFALKRKSRIMASLAAFLMFALCGGSETVA